MIVVVRIKKKRPPPATGNFTVPFECDYPDISAIEAALNRGDAVSGYQLIYDKIDEVHAHIRERRRIAFVRNEVTSIKMPRQQFEEPAA